MTTQKKAVPNKRRRSSATAAMLDEYGAAERLGLSVAMRKWRLEGDGPEYIKLGGAVRYDSAALDGFIALRRRGSTREIIRGADLTGTGHSIDQRAEAPHDSADAHRLWRKQERGR